MKYQAEFRKEYFEKLKKEGYELNGQMFVQMEKDIYIEWLEAKLQNTSSNSDYVKLKEALESIADYGGHLTGEDAYEMKQIASEVLQQLRIIAER